MDVDQAREVARGLLEEALPQRWAHSQGVARQARALAAHAGDHAELLEAAAWLHDIGYAPTINHTGFHPLDGARHLRDALGAERELARLVAHHSCAVTEAEERGLDAALLMEFGNCSDPLVDLLTHADMTTTPTGEVTDPASRVAEILARYDPSDPVHKAILRARARLISAQLLPRVGKSR